MPTPPNRTHHGAALRRRAFTLIELLIVVAIIAILAAIAVPNFLEAQTRAKVSRAKADLRTLATGLESYYVDNNSYPYTENIDTILWMPPGGPPRENPSGYKVGGLTSPIAYLSSVPDDAFKHPINDEYSTAPLYYERAGFGFVDGVLHTAMNSVVPADAVGTSKIDGIGADTNVAQPQRTPRQWITYSLGPDLNQFVIDRTTGLLVARSMYNLNNRYDPTNGTVSTGNVIRYPGGDSFP